MKRLMFFSHYPTRFGLDGANKTLMRTAEGMSAEKYEKLVLLQCKGAVSDYLDSKNIKYKIMPYDCEKFNSAIYGNIDKSDFEGICKSMESLVVSSKLYSFVKLWKPDIMYVNSNMAILGAILGKLAGAKVIWHIHDITKGILSEADSDNLRRVIDKYSDKILVTSKAVINDLRDLGLSHKTELVYSGADDPGLSQLKVEKMGLLIREKLKIPRKDPVIGFLGQIAPLKGIHHLIRAAGIVVEKIPNARFLVIGDYNRNRKHTRQLRNTVERLGLRKSVIFTGYYDDLSQILPAIDCLVVPSIYEEPFGLIAVEANLFYKPVIAYDRGGLKEIITHGQNGFLVEKDNISYLAAAIYTLINRPDYRMLMGANGHERAVSRFIITRYLKEVEYILDEVSKDILPKVKVLFYIPYPTDKGIDGASKILSFVANGISNEHFEKWLVSPVPGEIGKFINHEHIHEEVIYEDCFTTMDMVYKAPQGTKIDAICKVLEEYVVTTHMYKFILELKPDIIYANTTMAINAAVMGKLAGIKVLWHVHDISQSFFSPEKCDLLNAIIQRYADKIVGVSNAVKRSLMSTGQGENFEVVYNGVSQPKESEEQLKEARGEIRKKYNISEDTIVYAFFGQIVPQKGVEFFVKSACKVKQQAADSLYWIIGDPTRDKPYTEKVTGAIEECSAGEYIKFMGYYRNLSKIIPAVDIIVIPSVFEDPLPTVVIEGSLYKKPIVAFDRGGIPEILVQGKGGYVIEKNNIDEMAKAMAELAQNPEKARQMGQYGYDWCLSKFGIDRFIDDMGHILLETYRGHYTGRR